MLTSYHLKEEEFKQLRDMSRSLVLLLTLLESFASSGLGVRVPAAELVSMLRLHLPALIGVMDVLQVRRDQLEQEMTAHGPLMTADSWRALFIGVMTGHLDANAHRDITDRLNAEAHVAPQLSAALAEWQRHWRTSIDGMSGREKPLITSQPSGKKCMFERGAELLQLRSSCAHGDWLHRLQEIGIGVRRAEKLMQATLLYQGLDKPRSKKLLNIGSNKLMELISLGDELITELDAGNSVYGLTLDSISGMTIAELRRTIREGKKKEDAKDDAERDRRIQARLGKVIRVEGPNKAPVISIAK